MSILIEPFSEPTWEDAFTIRCRANLSTIKGNMLGPIGMQHADKWYMDFIKDIEPLELYVVDPVSIKNLVPHLICSLIKPVDLIENSIVTTTVGKGSIFMRCLHVNDFISSSFEFFTLKIVARGDGFPNWPECTEYLSKYNVGDGKVSLVRDAINEFPVKIPIPQLH